MTLPRTSLLLCLALTVQAQQPAPAPEAPEASAPRPEAAAEPDGEDEPVSEKELRPAVRKDADAKAEEAAGGADAAAMKKKLDTFLPVGRTMNDLLLPKYRALSLTEIAEKEDGSEVRQPLWDFIFEAKSATRLDENHIAFRKARFLTFEGAEDPTRATSAAWLEQGVYDVQNDLLLSDQPVRIDRETMQIEGDRMLHDRKTGLTRLTGRVRLRFYAPEPPASGTAESAPVPAPETSPAEAAPAAPATEPAKSAP